MCRLTSALPISQQPRADDGDRLPAVTLDAQRDAFVAASRTRPDLYREVWLRLAGRSVQMQVVGAALSRLLLAPLRHLVVDAPASEPIGLRLQVWDTREAGLACGRRLTGNPEEEEAIRASPDDRHIEYRHGQLMAVLDRQERAIVGSTAYGPEPPRLHDLGKPLQVLLAVWHHDVGRPLIHAGMVARQGAGVVLCGAGGAGKSTTALACLAAGFDYLGDDRVALDLRDDAVIGHSVYCSAFLDESRLDGFGHLADRIVHPSHGREAKPLILLGGPSGARAVATASVRALALPRITGRDATTVRPATGAEALLALAPSSLILPLGPGTRGMRQMTALVKRVPCFWLELGRDMTDVSAAVDQILGRALDA